LVAWLNRHDVIGVTAHIHPMHAAPIVVATRLGLTPTRAVIDGETRRTGRPDSPALADTFAWDASAPAEDV
jgi:hypothetical protein